MAAPFADNPFSFLFGNFQAAVNDPAVRGQPGGIQSYVWQSIRNDYIGRGEPLPAGSFQAVNQLLSLAGQQRQAALRLSEARAFSARSGLEQAVTSSMTAPGIHSRSLSEQIGGAQFQAVYQVNVIVEGEFQTLVRTHDFGFDLPQSLGRLDALVEEAAAVDVSDYGFEFAGGVVPLEIRSY